MPSSYVDGRVAVSALPLADQSSKLDTKTMKKPGPEDDSSSRNVNDGTPLHAVDEPSTVPHHVGAVHEIDPKLGKPTEHESRTKQYEAGATARQECGDISEDRLNFLPELIASVKKAALEDANAAGAPVPDDDDNGKKLDVATAGVSSASNLCTLTTKLPLLSTEILLFCRIQMQIRILICLEAMISRRAPRLNLQLLKLKLCLKDYRCVC